MGLGLGVRLRLGDEAGLLVKVTTVWRHPRRLVSTPNLTLTSP